MASITTEKIQKPCGNIFIWIGLIVISLGLFGFVAIPSGLKWRNLNTKITELTESNTNYENDISRKKLKLSSITNQFNKVAKDFMIEEKMLFPEDISTDKIAKILELYSIQYSLIDSNSLLTLNSISLSKSEEEENRKISANISLTCSKSTLKSFIKFIQTNQLPENLINAQNSPSSLLSNDVSTSKFLKENRLPIANIEAITSSENSEDSSLLETDIQINFFYQKENTIGGDFQDNGMMDDVMMDEPF